MEEKSEQTEKPHFFKNSLGVYFNETCFLLKSKSPVFFLEISPSKHSSTE